MKTPGITGRMYVLIRIDSKSAVLFNRGQRVLAGEVAF
jgi:hypothetical protein